VAAARRVRDHFDPTRISGLVARWRADTITASDGTSVATWTDSVGGIAATQGTSANQPTYHAGGSANAIGGRPVVSFNATAPTTLTTTTLGNLPKLAPLTVIIVCREAASPSTAGRIVTVDNGSGGFGWTSGKAFGVPFTTVGGVGDYGIGFQQAISYGAPGVTCFAHDGTTGRTTGNNQYPEIVQTGGGGLAGATTLTLGARGGGGEPFTGDVAEILVYNRSLTAQERHLLLRHLGSYYGAKVGSQYNAAVKDTLPVAAGSDGSVTEPSVLHSPTGVASTGHKYVMAFVNFDNNNVRAEDPNIVVSDDGTTWTVPPGLTNPVTPTPTTGHFGDPRIRLSPDGKTINLLYWRSGTGTNDGVALRTSTDAVNWTAETTIVASTGFNVSEPCPVWDGQQWIMYCVNDVTDTATFIEMRTTSDPTMLTGWSAPTRVNAPKIANSADATNWWHLDAFFLGGVMYLAITDGGGSSQGNRRALFTAVSTDYVNFDVQPCPLLLPSDTTVDGWDSASIYRGCLVLDDTGRNVQVWYSAYAYSGDVQHYIGHTTIPVAELP
jgi:hypothetical protein